MDEFMKVRMELLKEKKKKRKQVTRPRIKNFTLHNIPHTGVFSELRCPQIIKNKNSGYKWT